jgi:acyl carrier protein
MVASLHRLRPRRQLGRLIVLDRTDSIISDRVAVLVRALLAKRSIERSIGHDEDLAEAGLSSLDLVNLMLAVEAEFGLSIPEQDMRPANFRSIARIELLVGNLLRANEPAVGR